MSTTSPSARAATRRAILLLVAAVTFVLAARAMVLTAHADAADDHFLADLKAEGIYDDESPDHAIAAAHFVCQKLEEGLSPHEVAGDVIASSGMPEYHGGYFVGAAIDAYCPSHKGKIPGSP